MRPRLNSTCRACCRWVFALAVASLLGWWGAAEASAQDASGAIGQGSQPFVLMSVLKPILVFLPMLGWAYVLTLYDKDAGFFYLKRELINSAQLGVGLLGFGVMLLVPIFWIGYPIGLIVLAGGLIGYIYYRNPQVSEDERWDLSLENYKKRRQLKQQQREQRRTSLLIYKPDGSVRDVPMVEDPEEPPFQQFDQLLEYALPRGADSIDILVDSNSAKYRINIDGVRYARPAPEPPEVLALINYIKSIADMDLEERRKLQTGSVKVSHGGEAQRKLEVQSSGSSRGMQLTVLLKGKLGQDIDLEHLGLLPPQYKAVKALLGSPGKLVLLTAPEHQGVPTTIDSLLRQHDPYTEIVVTLEDQVRRELEGVDHHRIDPTESPEQIEDRLAVLLRNEPAVMMLSRIFGPNTPKQITAAADVTRSYIPLTQPDTFTALQAWIKAVGDQELVAKGLGMILSQRLVRRLCHTCRVGYTPDMAAIQKLGLPAEKAQKLYRASGKVMIKEQQQPCPDCHGLGYRGRVGVFEIMPIDQQAAKYIAAGELDTLKLYLRKQKRLFLQESALVKVAEGVTDIKEVTRVMSSKKSS